MYIYKTTNLINNKFYIGKSTRQILESKDYYGSGIIIKQAISKYGKENFSKEIIDTACTVKELNEKEKNWIKELNAIQEGYNISLGGDGGCYTKEQRLKIINAWKNKDLKNWGEMTSENMKEYFSKNPEVVQERIKVMQEKSKGTISAYNIITKETKRISYDEFEKNQIWVGQKWKGFYEIKIPYRETIVLTRVLEIEKLAKEIGVEKDWIMRRKDADKPFKHRVKRHAHLDNTIIKFHSESEVSSFFVK